MELLAQIQKLPAHSPLVILMTGFADVTEEEVLAAGAKALIHKPFAFEDLEAAIAKVI